MRYLSSPTLLFFVFFLSILILLPTQPFNDPGAFWHVRVGEWIVDHRAFPHTDPFTFSFSDKAWVPQQWGAEVIMAGLWHLGEKDAFLTAMAALLGGLGAWIGSRFLATGWHPLPTVFLVGFGLAASAFHFYARPHLITLVLMGYIMGLVVDTDRGRSGPRQWLMVLPISIIWTNLHGGIVGGLATLAIAVAGWSLWRILGQPSPVGSISRWARFTGIVLLGAAFTYINPFGTELYRIWWSIVESKVLRDIVSEHQPLSLARSDGQVVFAFGVFYAIALLGTLPKWPRVAWLVPLVWFWQATQSIRHGPIFCITALVALADLLPETIWYRYLKANGDSLIREPRPGIWQWKRVLALPACLVLICWALQSLQIRVPLLGYGWARLNPENIPVEMIEPLQEYARSRPPGTPIFNDANLGGFVLGFAPSLKIFMDDRCELYGDDWLEFYVKGMTETPEVFDDWAKQYPFERVILPLAKAKSENSKLVEYLENHPGWREVFRCPRGVMYERK